MKVVKSVVASTFHPDAPPLVSIMRCDADGNTFPPSPSYLELWVQFDRSDPTRIVDEHGEDQVLLPVSLSIAEATTLRDALTTALADTVPHN